MHMSPPGLAHTNTTRRAAHPPARWLGAGGCCLGNFLVRNHLPLIPGLGHAGKAGGTAQHKAFTESQEKQRDTSKMKTRGGRGRAKPRHAKRRPRSQDRNTHLGPVYQEADQRLSGFPSAPKCTQRTLTASSLPSLQSYSHLQGPDSGLLTSV